MLNDSTYESYKIRTERLTWFIFLYFTKLQPPNMGKVTQWKRMWVSILIPYECFKDLNTDLQDEFVLDVFLKWFFFHYHNCFKLLISQWNISQEYILVRDIYAGAPWNVHKFE